MSKLWYRRPADDWLEALPLGNGRMGAMVFGGVQKEVIALNEDTLWSGTPLSSDSDRGDAFARAQKLALAGEYRACQDLIEDELTGGYSQNYLPLGDMILRFDAQDAREYERSLCMDTALSAVAFCADGARHAREAFLSADGQALFLRIRADAPGKVNFSLSFDCQLRFAARAQGDRIEISGICPSHGEPNYRTMRENIVYAEDDARKGMRFFALMHVEHKGGRLSAAEDALSLSGADEAVIRFCARTSFAGFDKQPFVQGIDEEAACRKDMARALSRSYDDWRAAHIAEHASLYGRASFSLACDRALDALDTEQRLLRFAQTNDDPGLYKLLFDYGRYLLIACSLPGTQPANLQGIWNKELRPPWSSNYTININTEMNYWPAEPLNLEETHEPLIQMVRDLCATGAQTARLYFGARGATANHNTDLWRMSNPVGMREHGCAVYAFWPLGYAWLCRHVYEHYLYAPDREYLRATAYPLIREAARFFLDTLLEDAEGYLVHAPSTSPENSFVFRDGKPCAVSKTTEMTMAIVRETLENCLACEQTLDICELSDEITRTLPRLYPARVGENGQLLEWSEELPEAEKEHRHLSLLYSLYPGDAFLRAEDKRLIAASEKILDMRGGEEHCTGWGLAWRVCCRARLAQGDAALRLLKRQLRYIPYDDQGHNGGTYLNLFCAHPPFQMDGNFGAAAGIGEMLLQSYGDMVRLLPALPEEWREGEARGLRAHGGLTCDIAFAQGALLRARISASVFLEAPVRVQYRGKTIVWQPKAGECLLIEPSMLV